MTEQTDALRVNTRLSFQRSHHQQGIICKITGRCLCIHTGGSARTAIIRP